MLVFVVLVCIFAIRKALNFSLWASFVPYYKVRRGKQYKNVCPYFFCLLVSLFCSKAPNTLFCLLKHRKNCCFLFSYTNTLFAAFRALLRLFCGSFVVLICIFVWYYFLTGACGFTFYAYFGVKSDFQ